MSSMGYRVICLRDGKPSACENMQRADVFYLVSRALVHWIFFLKAQADFYRDKQWAGMRAVKTSVSHVSVWQSAGPKCHLLLWGCGPENHTGTLPAYTRFLRTWVLTVLLRVFTQISSWLWFSVFISMFPLSWFLCTSLSLCVCTASERKEAIFQRLHICFINCVCFTKNVFLLNLVCQWSLFLIKS